MLTYIIYVIKVHTLEKRVKKRKKSSPVCIKGRPCGSVAQLAECSHGKREALRSRPGRATIFSSPVIFDGQCVCRGGGGGS